MQTSGQSSGKRYIGPHPSHTGNRAMQPTASQSQSGWYIDANANYNDAEFLDAPNWLPTGSVRCVECTSLCIGSASAMRPGVLA